MNYVERTIKGSAWEASLDGGKTWRRGKAMTCSAVEAQKCFNGVKTQARWIVKSAWQTLPLNNSCYYADAMSRAPFQIGDIFYIREPWRTTHFFDGCKPSELSPRPPTTIYYEGNLPNVLNKPGKLRPAMFLQRRFARPARYQVTAVRCERVNKISDVDAKTEGCVRVAGTTEDDFAQTTVDAFEILWNSTHKKPGARFEDGPWVWVTEFRRVK